MKRVFKVTAWVLLACSSVLAQVTIRNPLHLEVPEQRVEILFKSTCKVVAEEFHVKKASKVEFPLILILGDPNPRYTADEGNRAYTIYLDHWNEIQFATSAMRLAIHRLVPPSRRDKLVLEILRRSNQIAPIPLQELGSQRDQHSF